MNGKKRFVFQGYYEDNHPSINSCSHQATERTGEIWGKKSSFKHLWNQRQEDAASSRLHHFLKPIFIRFLIFRLFCCHLPLTSHSYTGEKAWLRAEEVQKNILSVPQEAKTDYFLQKGELIQWPPLQIPKYMMLCNTPVYYMAKKA